jgi:transposase
MKREKLNQWARGRSTPYKLVLRAKIVLRASEGAQDKQIAGELRTTRNTVSLWRKRFISLRTDGLEKDAPRGGAPITISERKIKKIVEATMKTKPENATHWSTRSMAHAYGVSHMTVQRIWKAYNLQPHRIEYFKLSVDDKFEEKLRDVVGLYLNPPGHAIVLCVDEKTQIQALDRSQTILPLRPGQPEKQSYNYKRNGTTDLFAALNVLEGKIVAGKCHKSHRAKEFLSFLRRIDSNTPKEFELHIVLDNLSTHKTPEVEIWLLRHPRFHFHFIPKGCSWLNQIERWFTELSQKRIRRGIFRSEAELCHAIYSYIDGYNSNRQAKPFQWTATADDILGKISKMQLRQDQAVTGH